MEERPGLMSYDEAGEWLDEVAESLPEELFHELNGGIVLLRQAQLSPEAEGRDLYTLGLYHNEPYGMGRYISIYYGSFVRVYAGHSREEQKQGLAELLRHELTHHIESLAGVRDLEVKDELFMENFKKKRRNKDGAK